MLKHSFQIWDSEEYSWRGLSFKPELTAYLHEDSCLRAAMIIVPGGGYRFVSPSESGVVAEEFYRRGYNCFVLTYTTDFFMNTPLLKQPLRDLSRAMRYIRFHGQKLRINPDNVYVCGFSAGGHLVASICVHGNDILETNMSYGAFSNKPSAAILAYPVITSGEFAHAESFKTLLGSTDIDGLKEYFSVERHVNEDTPPCFIWHTISDETVPVENSLLLADACLKFKIPTSLHLFSQGKHGLSLANERWAKASEEETYSVKQLQEEVAVIRETGAELPAILEILFPKEKLEIENFSAFSHRNSVDEVALWPELADTWLKNIRLKR